MIARVTAAALVLAAASLGWSASPAAAESKVTVRNSQGSSAIDPTYMTQLQLSGSGFQSIKNGHGGIYVLFGAIKGTWQPSKGGSSGTNYFTVPDSESKNNGGYAKFVTFPGSDTADSANGGQISSDGSWSTTMNVPGAKFKTLDRNGKATTIDCREMTCGVITIGAHGVTNAKNETFTKVSIESLSGAAAAPAATATATADPSGAATLPGTEAPVVGAAPTGGKPTLTVDRASAQPGRIVAFSAEGLQPGSQVNATFANGLAAAGPLSVSSSGQVAGLIELPKNVKPGTYELRLVGRGDMPRVQFAVTSPGSAASGIGLLPSLYASAGFLALLGALAFGVLRWRRSRDDDFDDHDEDADLHEVDDDFAVDLAKLTGVTRHDR